VTTLTLESGALAVITNSLRAAYGYEVGAEVLGAKGKVSVGQEQRTRIRRYTAEGVSHDHVYEFVERFKEAYEREMAHFVDCVANDREPEATGEDGLAALELALLARRSHEEGRPMKVSGTSRKERRR
jgi:predicted dehydrogenase